MKKYTLAEVFRMDDLRDEAAVRGVLAQIRTVVQQWADGDLFAAGAATGSAARAVANANASRSRGSRSFTGGDNPGAA